MKISINKEEEIELTEREEEIYSQGVKDGDSFFKGVLIGIFLGIAVAILAFTTS